MPAGVPLFRAAPGIVPPTVGEALSLPQRMEQSRTLNGTSSRNCPLASPGGKLPGLTALRNRQGWLMRGGDRLVNECSWMSGICFSFYHSTYCCGDFKRSPPLISLFYQPVPKCRLIKNPASPRGKPRDASPLAVRKLLVRTVYYSGTQQPTDNSNAEVPALDKR